MEYELNGMCRRETLFHPDANIQTDGTCILEQYHIVRSSFNEFNNLELYSS